MSAIIVDVCDTAWNGLGTREREMSGPGDGNKEEREATLGAASGPCLGWILLGG